MRIIGAGLVLILVALPTLAGSSLTSTEKKQRKLVSRYYEVLELLPNRCPKSSKGEYLQSIAIFKKAYPEFIDLIGRSNFRDYAIKNFSENTSPISGDECLFFKEALDIQVNTERGRIDMKKNTKVMR